jgi:ABC-type nitrate/sulfonate/bicarbonate transport system substrate-binding protein
VSEIESRNRGYRGVAAALLVGALALAGTACSASSESANDESDAKAAGTAAGSAATAGGFVAGEPEPGTDIPQADVKFGMRPYADNAFYYVGIKSNFYKDAGIGIAPAPYGIKNNENAIAQMLNGTVEMQAMYAPSLIATYKTDKSLKQVMFTDYFNGFALLAPEGKSVTDYMKEGMDFKAAMTAALKPLEGKKLVVAALADNREFVRQAFEIAGLKQPELQVLDDPESLVAARAGRVDFASPTGAPTTLQFEREGWVALVRPGDIIDNAPEGVDATALAGTVGLAAKDSWINENPNTVLRFVSATYRTIDEIQKNPKALDDYATYLNSLTGLDTTGADLKELFATYNPLTDFEFGKTYCQDTSATLHYKKAYTGIITAYVNQGAVDEGAVTPDDVIWFCGIWEKLNEYKTQTQELLTAGSGDKAQLDRAQELFDQFNYLDAYRVATAASSGS